MPNITYTAAQSAAIKSRGNTLVSAAAGSGKTAALTAKIMSLLETCPEATLGDFLIVTYTKAAAGELRERIGRLLTESAQGGGSAARLRELPGADICTIHSFCMKILRQNFGVLGLSPDFSIADESEREVLMSRAMEDTVDDFFSGALPLGGDGVCDILALADAVGATRDAAGLDLALRRLYDSLRAVGADPSRLGEWADRLDSAADGELFDSPWGEVIRDETLAAARHYYGQLSRLMPHLCESEAVRKKYVPAADALLGLLERVIRHAEAGSREAVREDLLTYTPVSLSALRAADKTEASERFKSLNAQAKGDITELANKYYAADNAENSEAMRRTASVLRAARRVLSVYGDRYTTLKHDRGVLDYTDLELLALRLLVAPDGSPTPTARSVGKKYRFVFIDEYQDTNSVQDSIFRAVSTEAEKFFVGDIKQSVYRFRGAEPQVFSGYRRAWRQADPEAVVAGTYRDSVTPDGEAAGFPPGKSIFMSENFRCARPIIDFVNAVSRATFPYGGIPFDEADCLVWGGVAEGSEPVELCIIEGGSAADSDESGESAPMTEAEYVAGRIARMIRRGEARPSDIAILLRSGNAKGGEYMDALGALGIPVNRDGGSPFAEESEVVLVLDILRAVDNPSHDIPLAGAMLSGVFGFSVEELVSLRLGREGVSLHEAVRLCAEEEGALSEKCREFTEKLDALRRAECGMSADKFLLHLYSYLDLFSCPEVASKPCGRDNLNTLHSLARSGERGVFRGLYGFLGFIDEKLKSGELKSGSGSSSGGVSIVTIHHSKGLEYPVCFLCSTGSSRNERDERFRVLFDKSLGIGLLLPDPGGLVLCGNVIRDAIALQMSREAAMEEMRVLYVALTRARQRLIVTAKVRSSAEKELTRAAEEAEADAYSALSRKRMLDHILAANAAAEHDICRVTVVSADTGAETTALPAEEAEESAQGAAANEFDEAKIRENLSFSYEYKHLEHLPSKLSVSNLYPTLLDDREELPTVLPEAEEPSEAAEGAAEMPRPRFMTGSADTTPAERGTSTHVFLQFADFQRLATQGVEAELTRLREGGFITAKMAELVSRPQIEHMAHSPFMDRIRRARRCIREYRFNVALPAEDFTEDDALREALREAGERLTVQGVFDCVFEEEDGRLVLADYKTDAMTPYELTHPEAGREKLRRRHRLQLSYYAKAAALLFGAPPDEVIIYSTILGEAFPL